MSLIARDFVQIGNLATVACVKSVVTDNELRRCVLIEENGRGYMFGKCILEGIFMG